MPKIKLKRLKFIYFIVAGFLIISTLYLNANSLAFGNKENSDVLYVIDTIRMKGCVAVYTSNKSTDIDYQGIKIFMLNGEVEDVKQKSLKSLLKNGIICLQSSDFIKLLYHSDKEKYEKLGYNKDISVANLYLKDSLVIKSGTIKYYSLETEFIVAIVRTDFYKSQLWLEKSWFCENSYIKIISPNSFFYYK